jgi:signal transduction histidine kinase/CheY-like chemotaxis protein
MKHGEGGVKKIRSAFQGYKNFAPILFAVSTAMVLLISVNSNMVMSQTITMLEEATQQRLLNAAIAASLYVSAEELDRYHAPEDIRAPEYEELRNRLVSFAERFDVLYVYYWRDYGDGRIQYIVDNDPDNETQMTPANFFELDEVAQKVLSGEMPFTRLAEYTPTWDGLLSAFAPVYDRAGNLYCIAGVDISDEIILIQRDDTNLLNMIRLVALLVSIITTGFSMYLYSGAVRKSRLANTAKSSFLANMSHEIRTPMNAVIGMTELLLRQDLPREAKENLSTIKQAGTNLLSIINDILDFSKIEAGKLEIVEGEYLFSSLVNDLINIIRIRIGEKPLRFTTMIDGRLPVKLFGDEIRVRQILLNLLSNAVKYTAKGNIILSVRGEKTKTPVGGETPPDFTLYFEVRDTGIGIKAEDMANLFDNFAQFDSKRNRSIEGTGLGLAISRNLCRLMGGSLTAESVYGQGSVFTAVIPQKVLDGRPFAPVEDGEHKNCLVFEGRKTFALSITYTLESLGVPYMLAGSKDELIKELRSGRYRYVFIAWPVAEEIQTALKENAAMVTVVAMAEYGKKIPLGCRELYMPTQPVMVANILNGRTSDFGFQDTEFLDIRFTAPGARILVVDDIASNIDVVSGLLAPYKMEIDKAGSGFESIEMVKKRRYDLVLMDHMMPGMDGIEATAAIRAWEEEQQRKQSPEFPRRIPIIALTANAISGMKEMFLERGFNDYLSKPIEIAKLDDMMSRWIPVEKQIKSGRARRGSFNGEAGIVIPGVDVKQGIVMTGGTEAGYRKVLAQFRKDLMERLPLFAEVPAETVEGTNGQFSKGKPDRIDSLWNLSAFAAQAHAIKSAAGTIGAVEVSAEAAALEAAGKAGDMEAIRATLPAFREHLTELIAGIGEKMKGEESGVANPASRVKSGEDGLSVIPYSPRDTRFSLDIRSSLLTLKGALESKNMKEIDKLLGEIEQLPLDEETREAINAVSDKVLMGEYGGAVEGVNILLATKDR